MKAILVLSFLFFSTSSFAENGCRALGVYHKGISIPKEGYAKYAYVQQFLSEDNVSTIVEAKMGAAKKKALEEFQDSKNYNEERLRNLCPEGFEAKIEWSNEDEYTAYGVYVDVESQYGLVKCFQKYSQGGSFEQLEECLMDTYDVTDYGLSNLSVRASINLFVSYEAYCEVKCVPNENQSDVKVAT